MLDLILQLRGFYIKGGQVLSGLDGNVPKEYVETFKVLQDCVPPRDLEEIQAQVEAELKHPIHEIFKSFDPKPIGVASIGQVHKGILLDGTPVAIKIMNPAAEKSFRTDISTVKRFCKIAQPEQLPLFEEIEQQFMSEFDYTREGTNLQEMYTNLLPLSKEVVVPRPIMASKQVLVMTYLDGVSLRKSMESQLEKIAQSQNISRTELEKKFKEGKLGDAPPPPSSLTISAYRTMLSSRDYIRNGFVSAYNIVFGKWAGVPLEIQWTELPMESHKILNVLFTATGTQIFKHGTFNADAHPGNVLHLPNDGGKIGLIDMGQVKRVNKEVITKFSQLILALANDDMSKESTAKIAQIWFDCGYKTKYMDPIVAADIARLYFDRTDKAIYDRYGGLALMQETAQKLDPLVELPKDFIMIMRASLLLRANAAGLGHLSGKYASVAQNWKPFAEEFLQQQQQNQSLVITNSIAAT
jgi:aarF domain-containing kinase